MEPEGLTLTGLIGQVTRSPGLSRPQFPHLVKSGDLGADNGLSVKVSHQMVPGLGPDSCPLGRAVNPSALPILPESGSWGWPRGWLDAGGPEAPLGEALPQVLPPQVLPQSGHSCPAAPGPFLPSPLPGAAPVSRHTPSLAVTLLMFR